MPSAANPERSDIRAGRLQLLPTRDQTGGTVYCKEARTAAWVEAIEGLSTANRPRNPLSRRCAKRRQTGKGLLRRCFRLLDVLGLGRLTVDFEVLNQLLKSWRQRLTDDLIKVLVHQFADLPECVSLDCHVGRLQNVPRT